MRYYWLMTMFERLKLLLERRADANDTNVSFKHVLAVRIIQHSGEFSAIIALAFQMDRKG